MLFLRSEDVIETETLLDLSEEGYETPQHRRVPVVCVKSLLKFLFSPQFGIEIPQQRLDEYWCHMEARTSWGASHPCKGGVPLALYGDAARYTNSQGYNEQLISILLSIPLWCPKSTRASRFLVFAVRQSLCVSMIETVWPVFRLIAQQITELGASGLEVGRKRLLFGVTEIRGDWSWHLSSLNIVPHWNSVQGICFKCGVTRMDDESGYTHFNSGAAWIGHEYSNAEFLANMLKPGPA